MNEESQTVLQNKVSALRTEMVALSADIINYNERLLDPKEAGLHLESTLTTLVAQRTMLENQLAIVENQLAKTMRRWEPPLKRLYLATDFTGGSPGFVNHVLVRHSLDFSKQGVIQLGMGLWGVPNKHQFLFNHDFKVGIDLAHAFIQKRECVIVVRSKGIGKSCLGLVIVATLLKEDQVVAYEYGDTKMLLVPSKAALDKFATKTITDHFARYSFRMVTEAGLYEFMQYDGGAGLFRDLCLSTDLVHVVDVDERPLGLVETDHYQIVISAPNSDKLKRFEVECNARYVIYPPWTLDELKEMNSQLDEKQADDVLRAKYELFGGIPRQMFTNKTIGETMGYIAKEVNDVPLETWRAAFASFSYTGILKQVPDSLVVITESPGTKYGIEFASDYIMQLVIKCCVQANGIGLVKFLNALKKPPRMMSVLQGSLLSPRPAKYQLLDLSDEAPQ
ncbi:hypothetical protein BASA81_007755 [Batrachochytrium salamandrivorans]|nr:hypothetical protein BASA81_007755 [Batrachochytrium salamandrivorans]